MLDNLRSLLALFLLDLVLKILPGKHKIVFAAAILPFAEWNIENARFNRDPR